MLNDKTFALLNAIVTHGCESQYKIFSFEELASFIPIIYKTDLQDIKESLNNLSNHEFIKVAYQDEGEVCLRPLAKGRLTIENEKEKELAQNSLNKKVCFLSCFCGLMGGFLSFLLFYLLRLLGGI